MAYVTRDDLDQAFTADQVDRFAIRPGDEDGSEAIARAIAYATGIIDARLSVRFTLPFEPIPPILAGIACDLAIVRLAGADGTVLTDDLKHREKTARADLDKIAKGEMNLGLPDAGQGEGKAAQPIVSSTGGKLFTRESLRRF